VSGVKKRGSNRHWAGAGVIMIEARAVRAYLELVGQKDLDISQFQVVPRFPGARPAAFYDRENRS